MRRFVACIRTHKRSLSILAALIVAALGFSALFGLLHSVRPRAIRHAFDALSTAQIAGALALTATSYLLLTLYDSFALHILGKTLPWRTAALASFTSYTLSHNLDSRCSPADRRATASIAPRASTAARSAA